MAFSPLPDARHNPRCRGAGQVQSLPDCLRHRRTLAAPFGSFS